MPSTLRTRLLAADPSLLVREVVHPQILELVGAPIAPIFGQMHIAWQPNRAWGHSFQLGTDKFVRLGHRRGDHVASYPQVHGLTSRQAEEFLRLQVEGTLVHELGHAVLDAAGAVAGQRAFREAVAQRLPPPSTYEGLESLQGFDLFHEQFAEAFRWVLGARAAHQAPPGPVGAWERLVDTITARANLALETSK